MVKFVKKAAKWYFSHAACTNVWTPTGMIPLKR